MEYLPVFDHYSGHGRTGIMTVPTQRTAPRPSHRRRWTRRATVGMTLAAASVSLGLFAGPSASAAQPPEPSTGTQLSSTLGMVGGAGGCIAALPSPAAPYACTAGAGAVVNGLRTDFGDYAYAGTCSGPGGVLLDGPHAGAPCNSDTWGPGEDGGSAYAGYAPG